MEPKQLLFFCSFLTFTHLAGDLPSSQGREIDPTQELLEEHPWLTGPLLSPSAVTIPEGHANYEPYVFVNENVAYWNNHWKLQGAPKTDNVNVQVSLQFGLTSWMDFSITPQGFYNQKNGSSNCCFGDLPVALGFQLCKEGKRWYEPAVKISFSEIFPTGQHDKANPDYNGTDLAGGGSFQTGMTICIAKLFRFCGPHFLATRLSLRTVVPASLRVSGFNSYGGGYDTLGRVQPGVSVLAIFGFEYTLDKHWALALDIQNVFTQKTAFWGKEGTTTKNGSIPAKTGAPPADVFSLAPAIEYNFNENIGLIAGAWVAVYGRNATEFVSTIVALNWYV